MATPEEVQFDIKQFQKSIDFLPIKWDGKQSIKLMKYLGNRHWRQMEWIGFFGEFLVRNFLLQDPHIKLNGDRYGNVSFDLKGHINWDVKVHPNSTPGAMLNDTLATNSSIHQNTFHGLIILCVDCIYDDDGAFKVWHDKLKGETTDYEKERLARKAPSRERKVSARLTDIQYVVLDNGNIQALNPAAQRDMRNSGGEERKAKYSITHKQIISMAKVSKSFRHP